MSKIIKKVLHLHRLVKKKLMPDLVTVDNIYYYNV
jgi:hypothetical protein